MGVTTLRVLEGADRGRDFVDVPTPLTIGREDGNSIQVSDERVSRFHAKIHEEDGSFVLVDLDSTNGTRVNGETVQTAIIRFGDVIAMGRTVLLFGSRDEIARRLAELRGVDLSEGIVVDAGAMEDPSPSVSLDEELQWAEDSQAVATLHTLLPPDVPGGLSVGQAAQLAELLQYVSLRIRGLVRTVKVAPGEERVTLDQREWQNLLDTHARIAKYIRRVSEPE